jgi:hypothetical protein
MTEAQISPLRAASPLRTPWVELLFPAWILALSIDILATGLRPPVRAAVPAHQG